MSFVRVWHGRMKAMDGALLSLMINPIGNESTQLVSAVVYGLGSRRASMWSLGRMEWLALELVIEARHVLLERLGNDDCALWSMLDDQFKCLRRNLHLSFASLGFRPLPPPPPEDDDLLPMTKVTRGDISHACGVMDHGHAYGLTAPPRAVQVVLKPS